jgi:ABC-type branched-subunit amino acid transport system substrate-binding protein
LRRNDKKYTFLTFFKITFLLVTLLFFFHSTSLAEPLTEKEKLGKQIYLKTTSPFGREIKAFIGIASTEAPGSVMPCMNCHGRNGLGRPGSGIYPSNITFKELSKPYRVRLMDGRQRPAYNDETLARAITEGIDPAGNRLNPAMPTYTMAKEDLETLVTYLKRLGSELDPGVSETRIRIGTFLPEEGRLAEAGRAMRAMFEAYFNEINLQGGLYHRKIELEAVLFPDRAKSSLSTVKRLIDEKEIFAMIGGIPAGADREIADILEQEEVPLIGPYTFFPQHLSLNRFVFYLFSGIKEEMLIQLHFLKRKTRNLDLKIAFVYPAGEMLEEMEERILESVKQEGWRSFHKAPYPSGRFDPVSMATELQQKGVEAVLFFGSWEETKAFVFSADRIGWTPSLFLSGSMVGRDLFNLPARFERKVYLTYPTLPSDRTETGLREMRELFKKYGLMEGHLPVQVYAFAASKILAEGIKQSGKEISREKLVEKLEGLSGFETGLTPKITYGPNRRIGALGAHVVMVDLALKTFNPAGGWIGLE